MDIDARLDKTLRRASYRGVPFWVDFDEASGGKRLAKHQYAGGRRTVVEEMGLATPAFAVTLYLVGDMADMRAVALTAAMQADGPGYLMLPIDGGMRAYAEDFRRSREKDRCGYVGFDVTFVPDAAAGGAMLSLGDMAATVAGGIAAAAKEFARLF